MDVFLSFVVYVDSEVLVGFYSPSCFQFAKLKVVAVYSEVFTPNLQH